MIPPTDATRTSLTESTPALLDYSVDTGLRETPPPRGEGWIGDAGDGVRVFRVLAGPTGNAKETRVVVTGKGANMPLSAPASASTQLNQGTDVIMQLSSSDGGVCFESIFTTPATKNQFKNGVGLFKDKEQTP